jgi:hypothetical protein
MTILALVLPSSMLLVKFRRRFPLAFLFAKLFLWAMPKKKLKVAERLALAQDWAVASEV